MDKNGLLKLSVGGDLEDVWCGGTIASRKMKVGKTGVSPIRREAAVSYTHLDVYKRQLFVG